jgi:hypothetical protein
MTRPRDPLHRTHAPILIFLSAAACHKAPPVAVDAGPTPRDSADLDAGPPPARCQVTGTVELGAPNDAQDFDVGDGLMAPEAALVGVLRTQHGARVAGVARVPHGGRAATLLDLGNVAPSVSPPTLFSRGDEVLAVVSILGPEADDAGHALARQGGRWTLFRLGDKAEPLLTIGESGADAELSTMAALGAPAGSPFGALLAWDEDAAHATLPRPPLTARATPGAKGDEGVSAGEPARGVIRLAFLAQDMRSVARIDSLSPDTSDAERPKIAAREGGFWVAWIARKLELGRDVPTELEGPGEERAYRWLELLALDAQGKPIGPVRRLTTATGHVTGFEMASTSRGSHLDLYVGVDDERGQGLGGGIAHVVAQLDGSPRTSLIVLEGAGRDSSPWLAAVAGVPSALLYVDAADHMRAVRLDLEGNATGPPSLEPALEQTRPIGVGPAVVVKAEAEASVPAAIDVLSLALTSTNPAASAQVVLRWASCDVQR